MVVCKYFQQGNCRFGQYCRFEHVNNFANRSKPIYIAGKNIALIVAEDVLAAERGGQWILSCFGPFKEQPCIPGMEDVSPEEVRWNMYKAQTDGTTDQVKLQYQQMCQDMKAKHEMLKNPTPETLLMLEKIQKSNQDKSNFAYGSSSLTPNNAAFPSNTVFGASNAFGGNTAYNTNTTNSVFGGSSVFSNKPAFGGTTSVFGGNSASTNSMFGGSSRQQFNAQPAFSNQQTSQTFGNTQVFGNQSTFGQTPAFSSSAPPASIFSQSVQTSQSSVFGNAAAPTNTIFTNSTASSGGIFGAANPAAGSSMFGQAAANPGFPQASVFGNVNQNFSTSTPQMFAGQTTFSAPMVSTASNFVQPSAGIFGNVMQSQQNTAGPFSAPAFDNTYSQGQQFSAPFASNKTALTTTTSVFGPAQNYGNTFASTGGAQQSNVFGSSPFAVSSTVTIIDDSMYTEDSCLTDEDKIAFAADQFVLSKIPLQAPTKELR